MSLYSTSETTQVTGPISALQEEIDLAEMRRDRFTPYSNDWHSTNDAIAILKDDLHAMKERATLRRFDEHLQQNIGSGLSGSEQAGLVASDSTTASGGTTINTPGGVSLDAVNDSDIGDDLALLTALLDGGYRFSHFDKDARVYTRLRPGLTRPDRITVKRASL